MTTTDFIIYFCFFSPPFPSHGLSPYSPPAATAADHINYKQITRDMYFIRHAVAAAAVLASAAVSASPTIVDLSTDFEYSPSHNANPGSEAILSTISSGSAPIRTAMVLEHGKIVASFTRDDVNEEGTYPVFSVTKSWISLMTGMLIDDGALSLDETLGDIFYDKRCPDGIIWEYVDDAEIVQAVTIQEMLTMTSGLVSPADSNEYDWSDPYILANHGGANLTDSLTYLDIGNKGEFSYVLTSQIMSYVIKERSGLSPEEFANERIFPKLGIDGSKIDWDENYDNMEHGFSGLQLTPKQMGKFGQLYLQKGLAGPQDAEARVLSEEWIEASSTPQVDSTIFPGVDYGYLFWLFQGGSMGFPTVGNFYCAQGLGGQTICMHDELDRVMVLQIDLSAESGVSDTASLAVGFVAFNENTSFKGEGEEVKEVKEDDGDTIEEGSPVTEEPATEADDTSSSRDRYIFVPSMIVGLMAACSSFMI